MQYESILSLIIKEYSLILLLVLIIAYGYMVTVMILPCGNVKFLPSVCIGLFGMSSAAAIPTTIVASGKIQKIKRLQNL